LEAWYLTAEKENKMLAENADVKIADAYNYDALNFLPLAGSPVLNASYWAIETVSSSHLKNDLGLKNFPNPFSGITNIIVNVEKESNVTINVYNSMGIKVNQLYTGKVNTGNHEFIFDATAMPKGIYFGVVTVNQATSTLKMIAR